MNVRLAFVVFDDMTALDFVGVYDPVTRLKSMGFMPDLSWDVRALTPEVRDDRGLVFTATAVGGSLAGYDVLIVPGGVGTRKLVNNAAFIDWLMTAAAVPLKVSVCTGALLMGAAGFLSGRRATTHPGALDSLRLYCLEVVRDRVVEDAGVITSGGVTAGIDAGLRLVSRLAGPSAASRIAAQMDYPAARP